MAKAKIIGKPEIELILSGKEAKILKDILGNFSVHKLNNHLVGVSFADSELSTFLDNVYDPLNVVVSEVIG